MNAGSALVQASGFEGQEIYPFLGDSPPSVSPAEHIQGQINEIRIASKWKYILICAIIAAGSMRTWL
jgi:hypothetical protein